MDDSPLPLRAFLISKDHILELLDYMKDPEIPAINVLELGVARPEP